MILSDILALLFALEATSAKEAGEEQSFAEAVGPTYFAVKYAICWLLEIGIFACIIKFLFFTPLS